eukprot:NODE_76_length_23837_cov_1.242396.p14 type:complete len:182 gc:universal NODE_76_length_23837_cov_1.242396:13755-13210(-)
MTRVPESMTSLNQMYSNYMDLAGLEIICNDIPENFEDAIVNSPCPKPQEAEQQYQTTIISPNILYNNIDVPNAYPTPNITDMNASPQYYYASPDTQYMNFIPSPIYQYTDVVDLNMQQLQQPKYKHRTDFSKRHRRKFTEIERIYDCDFPGCDKSYESISHLNTHREKKKHGEKKSIYDFE